MSDGNRLLCEAAEQARDRYREALVATRDVLASEWMNGFFVFAAAHGMHMTPKAVDQCERMHNLMKAAFGSDGAE